jgi:glyoxylate carboligase
MTVPATLSSDIASLSSTLSAAYPLAQAPRATISKLKFQADSIVAEVNAAVTADNALIVPPVFTDTISYIKSLNALVPQIVEQCYLVETGAIIGRVATNLQQVGA